MIDHVGFSVSDYARAKAFGALDFLSAKLTILSVSRCQLRHKLS
jgi:hypothetical protein